MGKYDHILTKVADVQYKILLATLAVANEGTERNRLKRIELAMKVIKLDPGEKMRVEVIIEEDLDLEDQAS